VERGITLVKKAPTSSIAGYQLTNLKRDLLAKAGRGDEALHAAWAEYRERPSKYSYDDLMKYVPKAEREAWHEKALEAAKGSDLHSLIELLLDTKELERLAALVRGSRDKALEDISHHATEPAAKKLERVHPDVAARLWCAQGMRIVNAKRSKYYDAALSNFERARRCFQKAGLLAPVSSATVSGRMSGSHGSARAVVIMVSSPIGNRQRGTADGFGRSTDAFRVDNGPRSHGTMKRETAAQESWRQSACSCVRCHRGA
jgi:hypothetical protein